MKALGPVVVAWVVCLSAFWSPVTACGACIPPPEPPVPDIGPTAEEATFLDDFGAALRRFKGMSAQAVCSEYDPGRPYIDLKGSFLRGDADGDRMLTISDPIATLTHLFLSSQLESDPDCEAAMDADDSGIVMVADPIFTLCNLFLGGREPPPPFPEVGPDPEDPDLRKLSATVDKILALA